jgi:hypothetical protein
MNNDDEQFRFFIQRNGVRVEWSGLTKWEAEMMHCITAKNYGPTSVQKLEDDPHEFYGYELQDGPRCTVRSVK